jgi:hypothetical protein
MLRKLLLLVTLTAALPATVSATPVSVYGAWLCGNDACTWASVRNMTDFDTKNRWLINRGDGVPSVNLVVLSFVQPAQAPEPDDRRADPQRRPARDDARGRQLLQEPRRARHALHRRHHLHRRLEPGARLQRDAVGPQRRATWRARSASASRSTTRRTPARTSRGSSRSSTPTARSTLRRDGGQPRRAPDHRPRGGRPLAHRPDAQGHGRLAQHDDARARLRQRDGDEQAAEQRGGRAGRLAGAHRRQGAVQPAHPAAGRGQVHRRALHRHGAEPVRPSA